MKQIKKIGIGYYELEDGSIIDKGLYDLALFLEEKQKDLLALLPHSPSTCPNEQQPCDGCPWCKEGLCDYPYIGNKVVYRSR